MIELITVKDHFFFERVGLIILPDFSVPNNDWRPSKENITIKRPDGTCLEAVAQFNLSHFNISDPEASIDKRWRVTICIIDKTKKDVPIGSKLFVREELAHQLLEENDNYHERP